MNVNPIGGPETARGVSQPLGADTVSATDDGVQAMFQRVAAAARDTMRAGEAASIAGVKGDASVQEVVNAVMSAEQQLRAAIAVRDRVVAAYQEVSRMQI
jgi:flagellar hook-basal body complex protein FliE